MDEKRCNYYLKVICALLLYLISFTIVLKQSQIGVDYCDHLNLAKDFWGVFPERLTYPLWHFGVWLVYTSGQLMGGMPAEYACAFFSSIVNVVIYLVICRYIEKEDVKKSGMISLALCLVTPIYIPWYNSSVYLGQGSPNAWHNPTNMMAKPFMVVAVFLVIKMCDKIKKEEKIEFKEYFFLAVLAIFSVLAKPSFFQGFIPALGLYMIIALIFDKGKGFKDYFFVCISFVPAFLVVLWQFAVSFFLGSEGGGIGFGWSETMIRTPNRLISFLLVLLFPVAYSILNIKEVYKKTSIRLSWLYVVIAWLEWAFLYENNSRKYDGNFGWASELSFLMIWIITSIDFFKELQKMEFDKKGEVIKNTILFVIWLLHLACGIYYVQQLIFEEGFWV